MLMCGGNGDHEVELYNAQLALAYFRAHGVAANLVTMLDVDTPAIVNAPHANAKAAFAGCSIAARDYFRQF